MNAAASPEQVEAVLDVLAPYVDTGPGMPGYPVAVRVPWFRVEFGGVAVVPDDEAVHGIAERIANAVLNADTRAEPSP